MRMREGEAIHSSEEPDGKQRLVTNSGEDVGCGTRSLAYHGGWGKPPRTSRSAARCRNIAPDTQIVLLNLRTKYYSV